MKVSQAIQAAYQKAQGKIGLLTTDPKYNKLLALADFYSQEWQDTPAVDWDSLYLLVSIGVIGQSASNAGVVSTLTAIDMDGSIRKISQREKDSVILLGTDGLSTWQYDVVKPTQLNSMIGRQVCAVINNQLVFATPFLANDARLGASVTVPGFGFVAPITRDTQTVQVDDPTWLVLRMAAEFVRTDLVRRDQYPTILSEANDKLTAMIANNEGQRDEVSIDMDSYDLDPNSAAGAWY